MSHTYQIRLLGSIQIEKEGNLIQDFRSRKALALLGYLVRQTQPVSRSYLANLLWGDQSETRGRRNLSRELAHLSNLLPNCFEADYHTIQFKPADSCWVDTIAFGKLAPMPHQTQAEEPEPKSHPEPSPRSWAERPQLKERQTTAVSLRLSAPSTPEVLEAQSIRLGEAVTLYRGDFMAGFNLDDCPEFEMWLLGEQQAWRQRITGILDCLTVYYGLRQRENQALLYVKHWLELEPWQEEAHRYLMHLLIRTGQRSAALAQYEICRRILAEELGLEPAAETIALYRQIRDDVLLSEEAEKPFKYVQDKQGSKGDVSVSSVLSHLPASQHNLPPQTTPFIGRKLELAELNRLLADPDRRLVTILGSGGMGKTRLAIEVAKTQLDTFAQSVRFVPLALINPADFPGSVNPLVATLADALKYAFSQDSSPERQLLTYLQEKEMLIIFDGNEHLIETVGFMSDLLKHAPRIKILVTSRERLNLQEECLFTIHGMSIPTDQEFKAGDAKALEVLASYEAVQLFLQRARQVQADFDFSTQKADVVRICQLVEGMPLGIELAAAWVRFIPCQVIAREIEQNIDFLATTLRNVPERQRSLRAVFDHSWQLLSEAERAILKKLSVFRGGFHREAAEAVADASLVLLAALVDKSLLRITPSGRYELHEHLRQYAAEKLQQKPGDYEQVRDRHCQIFLDFLAQQESDLKSAKSKEAQAMITADIDNIRAAWRWATEHDEFAKVKQSLESLVAFIRQW